MVSGKNENRMQGSIFLKAKVIMLSVSAFQLLKQAAQDSAICIS